VGGGPGTLTKNPCPPPNPLPTRVRKRRVAQASRLCKEERAIEVLMEEFDVIELKIHNFKSTQVGDRYFSAGFCWEGANFKFLSVVV